VDNAIEDQRFLRLPQIIGDRKARVPGIIPVSRSGWYAGIKEGRYPPPVKLSARVSAWRAIDIRALVDNLSN
jgi:prophage regulatory protein